MNRFYISFRGCWLFLVWFALVGACTSARGQSIIPGAIDVEFIAAFDGSPQRYLVWIPPEKPRGLLMALHGHGSDRFQFMTPSRDETKAAIDAARKNQFVYVSPDYRAKTSWMGPAAEADCVQIIQDLKKKHGLQRVVVAGASMGGSAALTLAVLHPQLVQGVISLNGTANLLEYEQFQDAIIASFGGNKWERFDEFKKRSAEYWPERLTMPVAIVACGRDELVPPASVVRLAEILKKLKRPVDLNFRPEDGHYTSLVHAENAFEFVFEKL